MQIREESMALSGWGREKRQTRTKVTMSGLLINSRSNYDDLVVKVTV